MAEQVLNQTPLSAWHHSHGGEKVSDDSASRDLQACSAAGLLLPIGDKRGRSYVAADTLTAAWTEIWGRRPAPAEEDPYAVAREARRSQPAG